MTEDAIDRGPASDNPPACGEWVGDPDPDTREVSVCTLPEGHEGEHEAEPPAPIEDDAPGTLEAHPA